MKGQAHITLIVSLCFMLVIGGLLAFFTTQRLERLATATSELELMNVKKSIVSFIETAASPKTGFGSITTKTVAIANAQQVCFFDSTKQLSNIDPTTKHLKELFPQENVIVLGKDPLFGVRVPQLRLDQNPTCVQTPQQVLTMTLQTQANSAKLLTNEVVEPSCMVIKQVQDPQLALDIAFLPHGYSSEDDFNGDAQAFAQSALSGIAPFDPEFINFFRVRLQPLSCTSKGFVSCDDRQSRLMAKDCPHDVIVVLHKRSVAADLLFPLRSSALDIVVALNTVEQKTVLAHELGHIVGSLADEYIDEQYYTSFTEEDFPNCDTLPCVEWQNIDATSCVAGCARGEYFRSTQNSLMRDLGYPLYGPVNEKAMVQGLRRYTR